MDLSEIISASDAIDDNIQVIDLSNKRFECVNERVTISDVGILSDRGARYLSRYTGIPSRLLKEFSAPTLNSSVQEQLIRNSLSKFRVGYDPSNKEDILFIQPEQDPYLSYSDLINPIAKNIFTIRGNPFIDDFISIMTKSDIIKPEGDDKETVIGQQIRVSSTGVRPLTSDFIAYRIICQNGLIDVSQRQSYTINIKNASPTFIADILSARGRDCDVFASEYKEFVKNAMDKSINEPVEIVCQDAEDSKLIPKRVIAEARVSGAAIKAGDANLTSSGIPDLGNLWMYINLFTLLCQKFTQWSLVEAAQKGAFAWGKAKLHTSVL